MITATGAFFWILAIAAVLRLLRIRNESARYPWMEIGLLALVALPLVCRPHEDIFGGEDPGSYINSGISYNRRQELFFIDEMLAKVPAQSRRLFYYGHSGYGATKDACLWIRNAELAMVGPHFQPAYPLMISSLTHVFPEEWALYVVPLFTIFTALALRALALLTIPRRWSGIIAFILYISLPLTVWHGRCARPEIIAAFMFFGGCALTIKAWQGRPWKQSIDLLLGAACISVAPLFHVTAWLLVIPAAIAVGLIILHGRNDFFLYLPMACLGLGAYYFQVTNITDYYNSKRFLDFFFARPLIIASGVILFAVSAFLARRIRRSRAEKTDPAKTSAAVNVIPAVLLAVSLIAFLATLFFFRNIFGDLPVLGRPVRNYLYLTDFRVVANMVSVSILLLALAGLITWLTGQPDNRNTRIVLFMVVFPAIMLTGNINDFMMTRYMMMAIIPMAALFLTALIAAILPQKCGIWIPLILCAVLCAIGLNKRTHLVTTTEHRGFSRFLRPYVEVIKANKGVLLCEYSRIAAPLEHFFGVPTLGLDNERKTNYDQEEKVWAQIMRSDTNRTAYFITPYHVPCSELFVFEPVYHSSFQDYRLEQARKNLPTKVGKSELNLQLYKMHLKPSSAAPGILPDTPFVLQMDAGNMGLRNFANMRSEPISPQVADLQAYLATIHASSNGASIRFKTENVPAVSLKPAVLARWARADASLLLPAPQKSPALLLVLLKAPDPENDGSVSLQLAWNGKQLGPPRELKSNQWQWQGWQISPPAPGFGETVGSLDLHTRPAWNPGLPKYPDDLGILVSQVICLPLE